jgi:hypothetical protein
VHNGSDHPDPAHLGAIIERVADLLGHAIPHRKQLIRVELGLQP